MLLKKGLWRQFGAALDTLDEAISACPDPLWEAVLWPNDEDARYGHFWYIAYHTLYWLDLYLTGDYEGFRPPAPFLRDALPAAPYSKADIQTYLQQCRKKYQAMIESLTDEQAYQASTFGWMQPTLLELLLYVMRHTQEHAAQLSYFLGRNGVVVRDWLAWAKDSNP